MSSLQLLIPIVLIIVIFYFMMIRPAQRQNKRVREMQESLAVGDEVLTIAGFVARIKEIREEEVVVELARGMDVRMVRSAIAQVRGKEDLTAKK